MSSAETHLEDWLMLIRAEYLKIPGLSMTKQQDLEDAPAKPPSWLTPEAYIGNAPSLFDSLGALNNEKRREFIQKVVTAFEQWIRTNRE